MFNLFKKPSPARKPDETGVAIVAMVGNESDIIELFLRHNAPFCDKFYIILHNSFDNTASIIEKMHAEGFDIDVRVSARIAYDQNKITGAVVREVAQENRYDYIIPLDADEFLPFDKNLSILERIRTLPLSRWGTMDWQTFIPPDSDYFAADNPLLSFRARSFEPDPRIKVVLGGDYAKVCKLAVGNHAAGRGVKKLRRDPISLNIPLQHFPLRSGGQMVRKSLLGSYSSMLKTRRLPGESFHWQDMLNDVRAKNYQVDYAALLHSALNFASDDTQATPELDPASLPALDKQVKIAYGDLARINLLRDMDGFISKWIASKKR